jgi:hypothetical protein
MGMGMEGEGFTVVCRCGHEDLGLVVAQVQALKQSAEYLHHNGRLPSTWWAPDQRKLGSITEPNRPCLAVVQVGDDIRRKLGIILVLIKR